ncbi:hypothetical protein LOK49_LG04G03223 [Camellia lanceoleosa]|uniref:Uncharacterized protein n=1 Tax=Camellia lanceoleosa TaxID=1840588 RepID=A0ACC0I2E3_9ERIC|nr:hypothetical protein LOK49_LG04G03223 [Camellia lanceoleosa]
MARPVPSLSMQKLPLLSMLFTCLFILIGAFSIFSIVTFLCGSHRRKDERTVGLGNKKPVSRLQSNLMVKMISWRKVQHEEKEEKELDVDEAAVWRRTIMMGEKCRPMDFSGKILYDCNGNLLPDSPHDQSRRKS